MLTRGLTRAIERKDHRRILDRAGAEVVVVRDMDYDEEPIVVCIPSINSSVWLPAKGDAARLYILGIIAGVEATL